MLQENDMYNILPEDGSEVVGEELQRYLCDHNVFVRTREVLQQERWGGSFEADSSLYKASN